MGNAAAALHGASPNTGGSERKPEKSTPPGYQKTKQVTVPTLPTELMPKSSVQSYFDIGLISYQQSIAGVGSRQAWVKTDDRRLQLMDRHSAVKATINTDFDFLDVVLSPQGELLLTDADNTCIKSISPNKVVKTLFRTHLTPYSLCCLNSENIAVTFYTEGKVVIYSRSGKIVQDLNTELYRHPYRVAKNKVNNHLYICDKDHTSNTGSPYGKVIALDSSYHLQYEYTGQGYVNTKFYPMDICSDRVGHVLITNYYHHSVHILDKNGHFLQWLLPRAQGMWYPVGIYLDIEGNAWVGEECGIVKIVKYLQ